MKSHLLVGAKVRLYVNGKPYGRVQDFRWSVESPKEEKRGIDSQEPFELAPTTVSVNGNLNVLRISGDGGAEGAGFTVQYPDLSRERYFSLVLVESNTDLVLFQARRCSLLSQSWGVPSRGIVTGSLSFRAIEWVNEIQRMSR